MAAEVSAILLMASRVLFVYFAEIRWAVIIVKEAALHPLSKSYVDVKTGKVVARYPASVRASEVRNERVDSDAGGINCSIAVCLVLILTGVAIKILLS